MGKIVEKRKKRKKKGRPSLLDLQKRSLRHQHHSENRKPEIPISTPSLPRNYNFATPSPTPQRRSTRRNPSETTEFEYEKTGIIEGKRKKLKAAPKTPSSPNKPELNLDSNALRSHGDERNDAASNHRKRKVCAIAHGSELLVTDKEKKSVSHINHANDVEDSGPATPLPDSKLLIFILDRLQKKDTYVVFSEPVDPEELPDYHEVIENPMDFGTIRSKLASGAYANLEQFEKDVFLICSNAMQYNAPDTIYFRQARSIQELARKNFENLRQDSDDNEPETKIVRRGRPPTKNFKKLLGRSSLNHSGSDFSPEEKLATAGESTTKHINDQRKGSHLFYNSGFVDSSGRIHSSRSESYLFEGPKFERIGETTGSVLKGNLTKHGKKQFALEESRRSTCNLSHESAGRRELSVFSTFSLQRKQLMAVGLLAEYGYARSLARFSANIGTIAWKIASKKIRKSLPPGVDFGPGWIAENDTPLRKLLLFSAPPQSNLSPLRASKPENAHSGNATSNIGPTEQNMLEKQSAAVSSEYCSKLHLPSDASTYSMGLIRPTQSNQDTVIHPGINGLNAAYGNLLAQLGNLASVCKSSSKLAADSATANNINLKETQQSETSSRKTSGYALTHTTEARKAPTCGIQDEPPSSQLKTGSRSSQLESGSGSLPDKKFDSVPPDLNVRFQSHSSSSSHADTSQPDLALQL